ncbi:amino acid ABC transporter substrate-binding protein [Aquimarina sp. 2201CG5-10]|uniref:amino acid ABC transporter substrate-binding protein n=1 Tax=Aquimarina callyspongiae TaxID=3098150 RepID=UPI002AB4D18E|nr:LysM peptidoglycan-binding domain-containing protein [Aquimarina sp. 2201CG5-10]MDY8134049.1 LysM peptidoglycan-binding domain-containing protein [Aquimarina sp. 2201CG5-10]
MKKILLFLVLLLVCATVTYAQQYKSHTVVKGENVFRIAKRYNTTPEAIYRINPTAKEGISEGEILAIPIVDNQEYKTHEVKEGDTVYSLSKTYNTTPETLYILNPEAVNGINLGQVLRVGEIEKTDNTNVDIKQPDGKDTVLDSLKVISAEPEIIRFRTHKVRRKETLYGIAKKYEITVDDIKRHNKRLYSEQIKKKDKIRIPVYAKGVVVEKPVDTITTPVNSRISTTTRYVIKPKETKYGIARRHGITIGELEQLNPGMDPSFPIGMEIVVPTSVFIPIDQITVEDEFELYEVPPKETVYSILSRAEISSDSLFKMNPYLKDGLKAGMIIKIPKKIVDTSMVGNVSEEKIIDLQNKLFNFKPKKIVVMLPFGIDTLNTSSRKETEDYLKSKRGVRIALDFYRGVKMALDSAKTKGISSKMEVYDTQKNKNSEYIKQLIAQNNFDEVDAVIGPLFQANVETVAAELKKYDTPVFSPISNRESKLYGNFFQTRPTDVMLQDKLISYIEKDSLDKNIVIIAQDGKRHEEIKKKLIAKFPEAKVAKIQEGNYLYEVDLNRVLAKKKMNWVILESSDIAMISNVTALLNAKAESHQITLFTTNKGNAYDDDSVKNEHLSRLHLHYPSIDKEFDETEESLTPFVEKYKKEHGIVPNKYTVRGFDITYDILMRLGTADDLYHAASFDGTTEYVENKFNYTKKLLGGYYNRAAYLIKFDDDLKLTVVE